MRIRTMELPMVEDHHGKMTTPWVVVLDRCADTPALDLQRARDISEEIGAEGALVFAGDVQIGDDYATVEPLPVVQLSELDVTDAMVDAYIVAAGGNPTLAPPYAKSTCRTALLAALKAADADA